jgi:hypothetical protein
MQHATMRAGRQLLLKEGYGSQFRMHAGCYLHPEVCFRVVPLYQPFSQLAVSLSEICLNRAQKIYI